MHRYHYRRARLDGGVDRGREAALSRAPRAALELRAGLNERVHELCRQVRCLRAAQQDALGRYDGDNAAIASEPRSGRRHPCGRNIGLVAAIAAVPVQARRRCAGRRQRRRGRP